MSSINFENLTEKDIVDFFGYTIAKRGKSYYQEGEVEYVNLKTPNHVLAKVNETRIYQVEAKIEQNKLKTNCTCKCDFPCKHAAALIYYMLDKAKIPNKTEAFFNLIKKMNGIFVISTNNINDFLNAIDTEIEYIKKLDDSKLPQYLIDLFKALDCFTIRTKNEQIKNKVLNQFQYIDYNNVAFFNAMKKLKEENQNFHIMLEIAPFIIKENITTKSLLEFFANWSFVIESYYQNVKSSQALGIYNLDYNNIDINKIKSNKYKVAEYIKYLYNNQKYDEINSIINLTKPLLTFDSLFYYIKSVDYQVNDDAYLKLVDLIVTDNDLKNLLSLKDKFNDEVYLYLLENPNYKKEVMDLLNRENKMGLLLKSVANLEFNEIDDISRFQMIDNMYDKLKEKYNNELLFVYQNIIVKHILYKVSLCDDINDYINKLYNLKNGVYILYLIYIALDALNGNLNNHYYYDIRRFLNNKGFRYKVM